MCICDLSGRPLYRRSWSITRRPSNPSLGKSDPDKVRETLERNGATEAEIDFLLGDDDHGPQRVELNALVSSRRFIDFIERKLAEHEIGKVIPEPAPLADAFRLFVPGRTTIERAFAATVASLETAAIDVPADLDESASAPISSSIPKPRGMRPSRRSSRAPTRI